MISRATIDRIYDAAIIEDVVGEFVHLKKSGSSFKGLSPFANEKTPSFFVVPSKGIYKDFSSGKGGNVVDFLMQHEKLTYPEALRWLAARYQIVIEEDEQTADQQQEKSEREQLSIVTEFASKFFQDTMHETEEGHAIGLSYFKERGFREDIIKKFQLGYCPDKWDTMTQAALAQQYKAEYLIKAGLTRERDGVMYDFFRGRVMFPIHNISGKVIAFGGRTLKADKDIAKYFNSPESELYIKSNVLYGMHLAKNAIVKHDMCYLVEGYTDVISMHQAGVENVVASSGTSLTEGQIRLIRRYTPNITILYDGDSAGIKASFRGIDMILKEGMNVRVLLFPDGDDPDSFARKNSSTEIQNFIRENSKDFVLFKTDLLEKETGNDPIKKAELIKNIVQSIALIPDGIKRSVYLQECSRLLRIDESILIKETNSEILSNYKKSDKRDQPKIDELPIDRIIQEGVELAGVDYTPDTTIEKDLVRLLLSHGEKEIEIEYLEDGHKQKSKVFAAEYITVLTEEIKAEFKNDLYHEIFSSYKELLDQSYVHSEIIEKLKNHLDRPDIRSFIADVEASPYELSPNWTRYGIYVQTEDDLNLLKKACTKCVFLLRVKTIERQMFSVLKQMTDANQIETDIDILQSEKMKLDKERNSLLQEIGTNPTLLPPISLN